MRPSGRRRGRVEYGALGLRLRACPLRPLLQFSKLVHFLRDDRYAADEAALLRRRAKVAAAAAGGEAAAASADAAAPIEPGPGSACGYVVPRMFKTLIGKGHAEFAGAQGAKGLRAVRE